MRTIAIRRIGNTSVSVSVFDTYLCYRVALVVGSVPDTLGTDSAEELPFALEALTVPVTFEELLPEELFAAVELLATVVLFAAVVLSAAVELFAGVELFAAVDAAELSDLDNRPLAELATSAAVFDTYFHAESVHEASCFSPSESFEF